MWSVSAALPVELRSRLVSSEPVAVGWLETRTDKEMTAYADVMAIAHDIIAEGFSREAITPGITTTETTKMIGGRNGRAFWLTTPLLPPVMGNLSIWKWWMRK